MNTQDNGGPAFPIVSEYGQRLENSEGMTLRDYFAAKAMAAFIASPLSSQEWIKDFCVVSAYAMADKMIAERAK